MRLNRLGCLASRNEQLRTTIQICKSVLGKLIIIYHYSNTKARRLPLLPIQNGHGEHW